MGALVLMFLSEVNTISDLLKDSSAQTSPPNEVVIVDGGSHEATLSVIR